MFDFFISTEGLAESNRTIAEWPEKKKQLEAKLAKADAELAKAERLLAKARASYNKTDTQVELSDPTYKLLVFLAGENKADQRAFVARAILGEGLLMDDRANARKTV